MGIELLTQSDEDKLISLAKQATKRVVKGDDPTDVVSDLSKEAGLSPPMVERLCQALNIGRTVNLFKSSSSDDRLSEFPLADASIVNKRLYGDSELKVEKSAFYDAPATNFNDLLAIESLREHTFEKVAKEAAHADRTGYCGMAMQSAIQKAENVRAEYAITREKVAEAFNELNDYFRFYPARFKELESRAPAVFGKKASAVLETVYEGGSIRPFVKRGSPVSTPVVVGEEEREPYDLISNCLKAIDDMAKAATVHINVEKKVARFRKAGGLFSGIEKKAEGVPAPEEKQAGLFTFLAGLSMRGKDQIRRDALTGVPARAPSPTFSPVSQEIKAVDAAVILHDIVSNDEVLSEVDPKLILNVYNDLVQESPDLATHPILLRSIMRKAVSQGGILEPFELAQATSAASDAEKGNIGTVFSSERAKFIGRARGGEIAKPIPDYRAGPSDKELESKYRTLEQDIRQKQQDAKREKKELGQEAQKRQKELEDKKRKTEEENRKLTLQHHLEKQLQKKINDQAKYLIGRATVTNKQLSGVKSQEDLSALAKKFIP